MRGMYRIVGGLVMACLLLSGCTRGVNVAERREPTAEPRVVDSRIALRDSSLADHVAIDRIIQGQAGADLLKIQVTLRNLKAFPTRVNYMFEWYDENGMQVRTPASGWKQVPLQGYETVQVGAVAPSPQAKDFRFKLMEATD